MANIHSEVKKTIEIIKSGGIILFPTDTFWCIGCDATKSPAISKILGLTDTDNQNITFLVADNRMLQKYVEEVPTAAQSIIDATDSPITIVYDNPKHIALNLIRTDNTLAIRIPDDEFCYQLSRRLNGALTSVIAKITGETIPKSFKEIHPAILKGVDYVVNLQKEKNCTKSAAIIKITNNNVVKILSK